VAEDLVKPTDALNDLLYKSVEIRDSRHSIRLSLSMWRLSWITFIFLPLTFVVGFFGMNVDTFSNDPSLKWFFISAVPLMLVVLGLWYVVKHMIARSRQDPLVRGTWEHLFHDLAVRHPQVWSRDGPRDYVRPKGRVARVKWALLKRWLAPAKTIAAGNYDNTVDGLGAWARLQRYLAIRWLPEIEVEDPIGAGDGSAGAGDGDVELSDGILLLPHSNGELPSVSEAAHIAAGVAMAEAEPDAARRLSPPPGLAATYRSRTSRRRRGSSRGRRSSSAAAGEAANANRTASQASSGSCMVTEEQIGSSEGDDYDNTVSATAGEEGSGSRGGAVMRDTVDQE
ncbi:MAG: magnesium transporter CorA family protein, partial [Terriglobus roseus]|nr:magnesium transporter CorA family protein [Terriglobus roseus]